MIAGVADTHTALWYLFKNPRLSTPARQFMDDAAAPEHTSFVRRTRKPRSLTRVTADFADAGFARAQKTLPLFLSAGDLATHDRAHACVHALRAPVQSDRFSGTPQLNQMVRLRNHRVCVKRNHGLLRPRGQRRQGGGRGRCNPRH